MRRHEQARCGSDPRPGPRARFHGGTPAEVAMWREGDAEARANLAIEGMDLDADEHALFDMLREEAVPPPLATAIVLKLLDHPDADPALAITPIGAA